MNPTLYIIAGCNGAGKTTASFTILPEILGCMEFVNADEIARGLSPFNPESVAIEAGRIMLQRISILLEQKKSFAIETTLATRSYKNLVTSARTKGYRVALLFFWLASPQIAIERVAKRVSLGGHNIPTEVIIRRYWNGLRNLFDVFIPIVDTWALYDNNDTTRPIYNGVEIVDDEKYNLILESCQRKKN